jgi:DNA primase
MSQIQEVKQAHDIVTIIGERLTLQRSGASWKSNCPFHSEKSPSFYVNPQFQRYKCFGCGESGDVLTFLEKYEGMTFGEALEYLAERAGIALQKMQYSAEDEQRQRLSAALNLAKEYYHFLLTEHQAGEPAREYLTSRGITAESIKVFQLGYSLPAWDGLYEYLHHKKKFSDQELEASGLAIKGQRGRPYDRFRERLMFPLTNPRGQVVGFSGRLLSKEAKEAKYINSPETMLYHKSQLLFGYSELFQEIRKKQEIIVVEGEFDVISSAQAHVNNVVAIKGTALTQEHLTLMARVAGRVMLALDRDSAGVEATKRAIQLAKDRGIEVRIIQLPGGKDPDDLARHDPQLWRSTAKTSVSAYEFLIQAAVSAHDPQTPEGKRDILKEVGPVIGSIPMLVEREVYLKKLAEVLETRLELVKEDVTKLARPVNQKANRNAQEVAKTEAHQTPTSQTTEADPKRLQWERQWLGLMLHLPLAKTQRYLQQLEQDQLQVSGTWQLWQSWSQDSDHSSHTLDKWVRQLPADLQALAFEVYQAAPVENMNTEEERLAAFVQAWHQWQRQLVQDQIAHISQELEQLDNVENKTPDQEIRQSELLRSIVALHAKLKPLPDQKS